MPQKINLNQLAKDVTAAEGGKKSISIGQVKEVIRKTFLELRGYPGSSVLYAVENQK